MVVLRLRILLLFLERNLSYILVLLFELSLDIFLAYTCLVLVMLYLFRMLCPQADCLFPLGF